MRRINIPSDVVVALILRVVAFEDILDCLLSPDLRLELPGHLGGDDKDIFVHVPQLADQVGLEAETSVARGAEETHLR